MDKRWLVLPIFTLISLLVLSCADSSNSPENISEDEEIPLPIDDDSLIVRNIPWVLTAATMEDSVLDLTQYWPFHFLIGDTFVYGDDDCNAYDGATTLTEDSLIVNRIAFTTGGCSPIWFDSRNLIGRWGFSVNDSTLILRRHDAELVFTSRFTRAVDPYPFVSRTWDLQASNDTAFEALRERDLLPTLSLTPDRGFEILWYCSDQNPLDCNSQSGIFAIGQNQSIFFYRRYGGGIHTYQGIGDWLMEWRMMEANRFEYSSDTFTLFREDGITYLFVPVQ